MAAGTSNTTWCPARPDQAAEEAALLFQDDMSVPPLPLPVFRRRRRYSRRELSGCAVIVGCSWQHAFSVGITRDQDADTSQSSSHRGVEFVSGLRVV